VVRLVTKTGRAPLDPLQKKKKRVRFWQSNSASRAHRSRRKVPSQEGVIIYGGSYQTSPPARRPCLPLNRRKKKGKRRKEKKRSNDTGLAFQERRRAALRKKEDAPLRLKLRGKTTCQQTDGKRVAGVSKKEALPVTTSRHCHIVSKKKAKKTSIIKSGLRTANAMWPQGCSHEGRIKELSNSS